jgi:hypothetical protein
MKLRAFFDCSLILVFKNKFDLAQILQNNSKCLVKSQKIVLNVIARNDCCQSRNTFYPILCH